MSRKRTSDRGHKLAQLRRSAEINEDYECPEFTNDAGHHHSRSYNVQQKEDPFVAVYRHSGCNEESDELLENDPRTQQPSSEPKCRRESKCLCDMESRKNGVRHKVRDDIFDRLFPKNSDREALRLFIKLFMLGVTVILLVIIIEGFQRIVAPSRRNATP